MFAYVTIYMMLHPTARKVRYVLLSPASFCFSTQSLLHFQSDVHMEQRGRTKQVGLILLMLMQNALILGIVIEKRFVLCVSSFVFSTDHKHVGHAYCRELVSASLDLRATLVNEVSENPHIYLIFMVFVVTKRDPIFCCYRQPLVTAMVMEFAKPPKRYIKHLILL